MKDGRVAYRMKTPRRGSTHRVMTLMEFMARISILVPPPYFPLTRYHGVVAARSSWRPLVTPKPPPGAVLRRDKTKSCKPCKQEKELRHRDDAPSPLPPPPTLTPSTPSTARTPAAFAAADEPTAITIKHWSRLLDGLLDCDLYASASRLDWAVLLRRTHGIDALACPTCDGRLPPIATITDPAVARKILLHLARRAEPLPRAALATPPAKRASTSTPPDA